MLIKLLLNLTNQQKDLLRLLVAKHESGGGAAFILVRSPGGYGLSYPKGEPASVDSDIFDFQKLRRERLIEFAPIASNQWHGKPTAEGIAAIRRGFRGKRMMRDFESGCSLLSAAAMEHMRREGEAVESKLAYRIELAGTVIRKRREELVQAAGAPVEGLARQRFRAEVHRLRESIFETALETVSNGVREFANGLVLSQNTPANHPVLMRKYTGVLIGKLRALLTSSEPFQDEPLLIWMEDPLAQTAIQICEEVIRVSSAPAAESPHGEEAIGLRRNDQPWSRLVQEWEAMKATRNLKITWGDDERVPESDLRVMIAQQHGTGPASVTDDDIELAALQLCQHYERFKVIPSSTPAGPSTSGDQKVTPLADAAFWQLREDEFRAHDSEDERCLGVTHFFPSDEWSFHDGRVRPLSPRLIEIFKSLARDAARGIGSRRGSESWIDWLDLLRSAKDSETGKLLLAKNSAGSSMMSERERDRLIAEGGEPIADGALIEYLRTEGGGLERRLYWDTHTAVIENVFENSAVMCRILRSLLPIDGRLGGVDDAGISIPAVEPAANPPGIAATVGAKQINTAKDRRARVESFLQKCSVELTIRVRKTHIWRAAGHTTARQFQYWQAGDDRRANSASTHGATEEDDRNFRRILEMRPQDFLTLLEQKGLMAAKK